MKRAIAMIIAILMAAPASVWPAASLMAVPRPQFNNNSGNPCTGCKIWFYENSTTTLKDTYSDSSASVVNSNPISLNSRGESATGIFLSGTYTVILKSSLGSQIWSADGVTGVSDTSATITFDRWSATGFTPTYISGTSFSTVGDNRLVLETGRRIKVVVGAGTYYGRISSSSYGGGLTSTVVVLDTGAIDTGISSVSVGLEQPTNTSIALDTISTGTTSGTMKWTGAQTFTSSITSSGSFSISGGIMSSGTNTWSGSQSFATGTAPVSFASGTMSFNTGTYPVSFATGTMSFNTNTSPLSFNTGTAPLSFTTGTVSFSTGTAPIILPSPVTFTTGTGLISTQSATWDSYPLVSTISLTSGYTFTTSDMGKTFVFSSLSSTITATLPSASSVRNGSMLTTKNTSTWSITIAGTVDGFPSLSLYQNQGISIMSNGSAWICKNGCSYLVPVFRSRLNSSQSITSANPTKVLNGVEDIDNYGYYDNATNYRFLPTTPGKYYLFGRISTQGTGTVTDFETYIFKNGALEAASMLVTAGTGTFTTMTQSVSTILDMNGTTDYAELWTSITYTGSLTIIGGAAKGTGFEGFRIGN